MKRNYKVQLTCYFQKRDHVPTDHSMNLVEEADAVRIEPPVELTDQQLHNELEYE